MLFSTTTPYQEGAYFYRNPSGLVSVVVVMLGDNGVMVVHPQFPAVPQLVSELHGSWAPFMAPEHW